MNLCVIPARGGSKRIPRKNIKPFCGKPMIAWSIEAAQASGCFDRIVVSTDDEVIAATAREWGAETPFMRPAELADDYTGTVPVVAHAIEWHRQHPEPPSVVCCVYPTAPMLLPIDLQRGLDVLMQSGADYAFSVTSYAFPIQRALRITDSHRVAMFDPDQLNTRSQDLEPAYHDAGQYYWGRAEAWLAGTALLSHAAAPVIIPRYRVQDIDTLEDWERAEWMFKALQATES
jgi:N-acylneuraminate cytidylyltransferase